MQTHGIVPSIIVGIAIAVAGISIGVGFSAGRAGDRYVTVKGLAEREVTADMANWPITFRVVTNNLSDLQFGIERGRRAVTSFLREAGFTDEEVSYAVPRIVDNQSFASDARTPFRYVADAAVVVRTGNVMLVRKAMEQSASLVGRGVVLAAENWQNPTEFMYTGLNSIKPAMIEEATLDARKAAEKFALDSGSRVGKIRSATQGYFSIVDRDRNSPHIKQVRVVTTVEYYLTD